jgi:hypothetical protein
MDHEQYNALREDIASIRVAVGEIRTHLQYLPTKAELTEKLGEHRREYHKVSRLNSPFIFKLLTIVFGAALAAFGVRIGLD